MAEKWDTTKRCERCFEVQRTSFCTGQRWGGPHYLITCECCGWSIITDEAFKRNEDNTTQQS